MVVVIYGIGGTNILDHLIKTNVADKSESQQALNDSESKLQQFLIRHHALNLKTSFKTFN